MQSVSDAGNTPDGSGILFLQLKNYHTKKRYSEQREQVQKKMNLKIACI